MKGLSSQWNASSNKEALHQQAASYASQLDAYGVHASYNGGDGTWQITRDDLNPSNIGKLLYNCYHTGGFVGDKPLKPNEQNIKAEKGELVLTSDQQDSIATQFGRINAMIDKLANTDTLDAKSLVSEMAQLTKTVVNNVTNNTNQPIEITIGDTIINGGSEPASVIADEVRNISRNNLNQIARMLKIKL